MDTSYMYIVYSSTYVLRPIHTEDDNYNNNDKDLVVFKITLNVKVEQRPPQLYRL